MYRRREERNKLLEAKLREANESSSEESANKDLIEELGAQRTIVEKVKRENKVAEEDISKLG